MVPGTYELSLHSESLPEHATVEPHRTQTVELTPGAKIKDLRFPAYLNGGW
jgi:hypothetical protein